MAGASVSVLERPSAAAPQPLVSLLPVPVFVVGPLDHVTSSGRYRRALEEVERPLIAAALRAAHGNQIKAAQLLGLNRNTLRKKIRILGVEIIKYHYWCKLPIQIIL